MTSQNAAIVRDEHGNAPELTDAERETLNRLFELSGVRCVLHPCDDWDDAINAINTEHTRPGWDVSL